MLLLRPQRPRPKWSAVDFAERCRAGHARNKRDEQHATFVNDDDDKLIALVVEELLATQEEGNKWLMVTLHMVSMD